MFRFRFLAVGVLTIGSIIALAQQALTNDAVIKMSKGGLSDDLIVQTIQSQPGAFQTGASDLVALKQGGGLGQGDWSDADAGNGPGDVGGLIDGGCECGIAGGGCG